MGGSPFFYIFPIAFLSSSRVAPGDPIIVTAGIGRFSSRLTQAVINGRRIWSDDEGKAVDTVLAATKPGNYSIPVEVWFVKPDGDTVRAVRNFKYTVVK